VEALNEDEALVVRAHQDGGVQALGKDALSQGFNLLRVQRLAPLHWYIDILDGNHLPLQHCLLLLCLNQSFSQSTAKSN
jgi:hypothetical protein